MTKRSLLDLPIYTYSPDQDGADLPCLAYIGRPGQVPMHFTGRTPFKAHQRAEAWRQSEAKAGRIKVSPEAEDA